MKTKILWTAVLLGLLGIVGGSCKATNTETYPAAWDPITNRTFPLVSVEVNGPAGKRLKEELKQRESWTGIWGQLTAEGAPSEGIIWVLGSGMSSERRAHTIVCSAEDNFTRSTPKYLPIQMGDAVSFRNCLMGDGRSVGDWTMMVLGDMKKFDTHIKVLKTPYFTTTTEEGHFKLETPAGIYLLYAWNEYQGEVLKGITVLGPEAVSIDFKEDR